MIKARFAAAVATCSWGLLAAGAGTCCLGARGRSCAPARMDPRPSRMLTDPTYPLSTPEWRITNPRVEYLAEPFATGIDVPAPRFGWVVDPVDDAAGGYPHACRSRPESCAAQHTRPLGGLVFDGV